MEDYKKCLQACLGKLSARLISLKRAYAREVKRRKAMDEANHILTAKMSIVTDLTARLSDVVARTPRGRFKRLPPALPPIPYVD